MHPLIASEDSQLFAIKNFHRAPLSDEQRLNSVLMIIATLHHLNSEVPGIIRYCCPPTFYGSFSYLFIFSGYFSLPRILFYLICLGQYLTFLKAQLKKLFLCEMYLSPIFRINIFPMITEYFLFQLQHITSHYKAMAIYYLNYGYILNKEEF